MELEGPLAPADCPVALAGNLGDATGGGAVALATLVAMLGIVQRDVDGEAGAFALAALDLHPAVVALHDFLHDGETDAQPAALAVATGIRPPAELPKTNPPSASTRPQPAPARTSPAAEQTIRSAAKSPPSYLPKSKFPKFQVHSSKIPP